jgi:hypothetical protein
VRKEQRLWKSAFTITRHLNLPDFINILIVFIRESRKIANKRLFE